jgi:HEPN domain-containing protein
MNGDRLPPDDPVEWLRRAKSSLSLAHQQSQDIYLEDLCFQAQQAAEKAIKAVYIAKGLVFPYVHDISQLLSALEKNGIPVPAAIRATSKLTIYAALTRYPGLGTPLSKEEYDEAMQMAEAVVSWAKTYVDK